MPDNIRCSGMHVIPGKTLSNSGMSEWAGSILSDANMKQKGFLKRAEDQPSVQLVEIQQCKASYIIELLDVGCAYGTWPYVLNPLKVTDETVAMISAAIIILSQFILSLRADKLITVISDGEPDQFIRSHPIDRMQRLYGNENDQNFGHGNITHDMTAYSPAISAILSIILPLIAVATIGGNFLVILAVTLVKKLQTPSNILIVSLAFSDFFVGLLVLPFAILDLLKGYWPFNEPLCDMYISFDVLLCTASILNLCAISIDRYLVITRPLTYVSKRTPCRMAQMIAATWIISALICIPPNIGWKSPFQEGRCEYSEDVGYQIYATFCAFYLPLLVMLVLYGKIFKLAREMSRNEQRQMMPYTQNNLQHQTSQTAVDPNDLNSRTCLPRQVESSSEKCDNDAFVNSVTSGSNPGPVDTTGLRPLTNGKSEEDRIRRQTANTVTFSEDESHTRASFWKSPSNPDLVRRRSKNSSETKVIKTLGIIMGCFCLCWLPFFMVQFSALPVRDKPP
ncbi:7 transmembrane receptor [Opisthorchis viverrini]|uniref:7 transmembrane receptor n=1 Tax=Opisthorchis viverrini TaxID=6198 RepID=A0A1S8WHV9_OPIVI|nr:7 transmembrane receptor [Opisthorchis viverrini]